MREKAVSEKEAVKQVGIWIRVSTEDQAKGESPEHHEKHARFYAESKGWHVREVYHLEAVSGKSVIGHTETQRMLEHIRCGHITGLIFSKLARLARSRTVVVSTCSRRATCSSVRALSLCSGSCPVCLSVYLSRSSIV